MHLPDPLEPPIRYIREFFQDQWFDRTRRVRTSGNASLQASGIAAREFLDSEWYMPARPAHIRQALRALPVHELPDQDLSGFSYIDLGSGKGRTLFIAAEFPFPSITGVELSALLHAQACANIRAFRSLKQRCRVIRSLNQNARDFTFPDTDLVLYLFNPFGRDTMRAVLSRLEQSLRQKPRHVFVILLWPRCADLVAAVPGMRLSSETGFYQIFEAPPHQNESHSRNP